jgi:hypothetical protein
MPSRDNRISRWFAPLALGGYLGAWVFAFVLALVEPKLRWDWLPHATTIKWLVYTAILTVLATAQAAILVTIDVLLLKMRARVLPTGWRAFAVAAAAPLPAAVTLRVWPSLVGLSPWPWIFAIAGASVATCVVLRLAFGTRPDAA